MSTIKQRNMDKIMILLKQNKKLFHISDLELLWKIENQATLRSTISRYLRKGILIRIYRGFYSVIPLKDVDPLELGARAIHNYSYISAETVLAQSGIIFQSIPTYTFCSTKTTIIRIAGNTYKSRQLKDIYLYNKTGIIDKGIYKIASPERAMADMLYFNPMYHFDSKDRVDQHKFMNIRKEVYGI